MAFPGGALVHFAVSQSEVMMSTRLAGPASTFLPFNQGDHGSTMYVLLRGQAEIVIGNHLMEVLEPGNIVLRQHHAQLGTVLAAKPTANAAPATAKAAPAVAAPAAAGAARPAASAVAAVDPSKLVASRLEAWRQAWEAKDAGRYLAFYGSAFTPAVHKHDHASRSRINKGLVDRLPPQAGRARTGHADGREPV